MAVFQRVTAESREDRATLWSLMVQRRLSLVSDDLCWHRNDEDRFLCITNDACRESRFSVKYFSPLNHRYSHSFMINSCTYNDAGRYSCYECLSLTSSDKKTAHLVVLGTHCILLSPALGRFCARCAGL